MVDCKHPRQKWQDEKSNRGDTNNPITYMFQALLLQFLNSCVFRDLLQPLCAVHGADVYFQHFAGEYLLLLDEHSCSLESKEHQSSDVS